jgi:hypothetical protein
MVSYSTGQPLATWRWLERRCLGGLWHLCSGGGTPREPPLRASTSLLEARSPPRSDPANSHDFRPRAIPRSSRSAALLLRQMRPCVVSRRFVSIAEVHSIRARAHVAQSEPEMARDRFGFLKRHGASMPSRYPSVGGSASLVALPGVRDLLFCAKHLFVLARTVWRALESSRASATRLLAGTSVVRRNATGCSRPAGQCKPARPSRLA